MLKTLRMDLHIHTCLSPCGMPENVPTRIAHRARECGLDVIGVCDHNASGNVDAVRKAAGDTGVSVFAGMEVTTQEEVHIIALFDHDEDLFRLQEQVDRNLHGSNNPDAFGEQYIVDPEDYVIGINRHLLMGATEISVERLVELVHSLNGLVIAAHVDREAFGIIGQLGMIPEDLEIDAVELSPDYGRTPFSAEGTDFPRVTSSDAHALEDIGRVWTEFLIRESSVSELKMALRRAEGRRVVGPESVSGSAGTVESENEARCKSNHRG